MINYSQLTDDELDEMFQWRRREYDFHIDLHVLLKYQDDPDESPQMIQNVREGLKLLTPNVVKWAFNNDDWRPAQSMATFVACAKMEQYTDLVGQQLVVRYFCYPYIYSLARIATPQAKNHIEKFLVENMTVEKAKSPNILRYLEPINLAIVVLDWLIESYSINSSISLDKVWHDFNKELATNIHYGYDSEIKDYEATLEEVRQKFSRDMEFFAQNFD